MQLVFYRKTGSDDILVRVLLNERDVTLPVRTDKAPFYPWEDLRAYWMSVVQAISFPEQAK